MRELGQLCFVAFFCHMVMYCQCGSDYQSEIFDEGIVGNTDKRQPVFQKRETAAFFNASPRKIFNSDNRFSNPRPNRDAPHSYTNTNSALWVGFLVFLLIVAFFFLFVSYERVNDIEIPKEASEEKIQYTKGSKIPVVRRYEKDGENMTYVTEIVTKDNVKTTVKDRSSVLSDNDKKHVAIAMKCDPKNIRWEAVRTIKEYWSQGTSYKEIERLTKGDPINYKLSSIKKICPAFKIALEESLEGVEEGSNRNWFGF